MDLSPALAGKYITVGVTGGIAVFKVAQLVSNLKARGADLHVIMTRSAQEFVRPLTFQVLSGRPVYTGLFEHSSHYNVLHVDVATQSDLVVVVPATANVLGKVAGGIADDLLTTVIMAAACPVLFCPAMNVNMYNNPVVRRNIDDLRGLGYHFVEPGVGRLACGAQGRGRLADLEVILENITRLATPAGNLRGLTVMVTAGPTIEPIDPVRYLTNRSTGKMGYAVAEAAAGKGAKVILISGPSVLTPPRGVDIVRVETALQMFNVVMERFPETDIVVKTAAVADYRPKDVARQKIKKKGDTLSLEFTRNPDILAELGRNKTRQILVGFAAETEDLERNARQKVVRKNMDFLVANDVTQSGAGFGADTNIVKFVFPDGTIKPLPLMDKLTLAHRILDNALLLFNKKG